MSRFLRGLGILIVLPMLSAGDLRAQDVTGFPPAGAATPFGLAPGAVYSPIVGWSSTLQEGVLRGWGEAAIGMGFFNFYNASALAIEADTAMRLNEYGYLSFLEWERRHREQKKFDHQRQVNAWANIHRRLVDAPELSDIHRGDALNALAWRIVSLSPSGNRFIKVGVPGGTIDRIRWIHVPTRSAFSLARLDVKGHWPRLLSDPAHAAARKDYEAALDRVLDQVFRHKLEGPALDDLDRAIENIRREASVLADQANEIDRKLGEEFLGRLAESARMLRYPGIEEMLRDEMNYRGTTVADLLAFMKRHGIQFSSAETPMERDLYQRLHALLSEHRAEIEGVAVADAKNP
ncbi:MAG: hypothetical protein U0790_06380 [Isosphaeraceae bacterium]